MFLVYTLYRIAFEVYLRGLPTEMECLSKIREVLNSLGKCIGSATTFICFYKKSIVKVIPKFEETSRRMPALPPLYEPIQQTLQIVITLESNDVENLAEVTERLHSLVKECSLMIKLTG